MGQKLTVRQAAERMGISARLVRRLIASGQLPAYRVGTKVIRIDSDDLRKAVQPVTPSGKF
jgi:excisionase family DNA binding protein